MDEFVYRPRLRYFCIIVIVFFLFVVSSNVVMLASSCVNVEVCRTRRENRKVQFFFE